ncbi:sugar transferase [bacterium]|nr:sugar transferase [bacterium]
MSKQLEKLFIFVSDFLMINAAFFIWCRLRGQMGFFTEPDFLGTAKVSIIIFLYWFVVFLFFGMYKPWSLRSRIDEIIEILKTVTIGIFIIFILTVDLRSDLKQPMTISRATIFAYWALMAGCISFGRVFLITIQKKLHKAGIGLKKSVIVGWRGKAFGLFNQLTKTPGLGYQVKGFVVSPQLKNATAYKNTPVLGTIDDLDKLIPKHDIQEVLIALPQYSKRNVEQVISRCDGTAVGLKIVPDLYDLIVGQVKTNQVFGFPLIEIFPRIMPAWEWKVKRFGDVVFSLLIFIGFLPVWLLVTAAIKIDSRGPLFYKQKRVGMNGKVYTMIKFRSMVHGAEKMTGPVWATWDDKRVTRVGKIMRRTRIDEIPQLLNVIKGDMSWVGPRPERPFFVEKFKKEIPLYARRLRVRPGITGWAQIKGGYDQTIEHVKQKLTYDLFYIENMSLRMDLKIILVTVYVMLKSKGH